MSNFFSQLIARFLTSVFSFIFLLTGPKTDADISAIETPEDFSPVLRFVVCSDVHLNGDENQSAAKRFGNLFDDMYALAEVSDYKNIDAVLVAGDFTESGLETEYEMFNKIADEHKKDSTQLLTVMGNHEFIAYRDTDASVGYDVYKKYINEDVDTDVVINGYHFINVSYDDNGKSFTGKMKWLDERLRNATQENPDKPVFVMQHPHPAFTVYGSVNWGDFATRLVLSRYPQVVCFSGHSHYAASDPRSVWQGEFTSVGCGALSAFMGNLNYIDGDKNAPGEAGGAWVVECDADGNISMRLYDIVNRMFFENIDYYFTDIHNSSSRAYTWKNCQAVDTAPVFPEEAEISYHTDENGDVIITFPEAKGYYDAENYKILITNGENKKVYEGTVISEYVRATDDPVSVNIGNQQTGSYNISITAYSPYALKGASLNSTVDVLK